VIRRLLLAAVLLAVAAAAWVAWVNYGGEGAIDTAVPTTPASPQLVARGEYLARVGNCMTCHTDRGGQPFAGGRLIDTPFGAIYTSNLTPHAATGIGQWSPDHFWRAMHHGRSRDGRLLYPAFPYPNYTLVTREDSDAIYAYLRSLPAVERPNRAHDLRWPYSTQAALAAWRALYFRPATHEADAAKPAEWNRGAYLVRGLGHCAACHTARNALGASLVDFSGGLIPMQNWYAPSLANEREAGVQHWPREQVVALLKTGQAHGGTVLGPMAEVVLNSTQYMSDADLGAMAAFLQALPPGEPGPQPRAQAATAGFADRGARLYADRCVQCHGARGEGVPGAYPPLAGNRAVMLPVTANLVQVVLYGGYPPATQGNPRPYGMPPYALQLSDSDVAAVLTHIRTSWGNSAPAVSELEVARQRGSAQ
jgi:mono/diheme cytochrome c family protein